MKPSLLRWIGDADRLRHLRDLGATPPSLDDEVVERRGDDLYIGLVGELFELMRTADATSADYARIGNTFVDVSNRHHFQEGAAPRISPQQARLFGAAAFYFGGFPASAYLSVKNWENEYSQDAERACVDLLGRRAVPQSGAVRRLLGALLNGNAAETEAVVAEAIDGARQSLLVGPSDWIPARLFEQHARRFQATNLRAVLPNGDSEKWSPLVASLLKRRTPTWEYFPSQIQAIQAGLLTSNESFSLQMPTGAGKTALCETLLFSHAHDAPTAAAVLLVPYRSLASELRASVVKNLNNMNVITGCIYGGTVPTSDEVRGLDRVQALVATPETLSGALSANPSFLQRLSLVICDEGHLLDSGSRGIGLELLLARLRARPELKPRCVFVSAIVPNIEEINAWLGGNTGSVVKSDYRASIAEFGVLRQAGSGRGLSSALEMHPHEAPPIRFEVPSFLPSSSFQYVRASTRRAINYPHSSFKTQAIAAARSVLSLGPVAVFAANKHGTQGAMGLADELLRQIANGLPLPTPYQWCDPVAVADAADYLRREFGPDWIGTRVIEAGAILHHGDIPQEVREVLEDLLRSRKVALAICTSTLAEGVNFPIRSLVLYSVRRLGNDGRPEDLLTRDIKNLVGRAGRAGSDTKGLVICVNAGQWPLVESVALQAPGEDVRGSLAQLLRRLESFLARQSTTLSNAFLEGSPPLQPLVDGIDATLIDLAAEEVGEPRLVEIAERIANETFAASSSDATQSNLLRQVFALRARKIADIRANGRIGWLRNSGARARLLTPVESLLLPLYRSSTRAAGAVDDTFLGALLDWALTQSEVRESITRFFRPTSDHVLGSFSDGILLHIRLWLSGATFAVIASRTERSVDDVLGMHTAVVGYSVQTVVEQGVALLKQILESQGDVLPDSVDTFVQQLRYGLPSRAACILAAEGVRHRAAAVAVGQLLEESGFVATDVAGTLATARLLLQANSEYLLTTVGPLVYTRLVQDLAGVNT